MLEEGGALGLNLLQTFGIQCFWSVVFLSHTNIPNFFLLYSCHLCLAIVKNKTTSSHNANGLPQFKPLKELLCVVRNEPP